MAITNGYTERAVVKSALRITDADDDTVIDLVIETASRLIDGECNRRFHVDGSATARVFSAVQCGLVRVDDFSTLTGLVVKTDTTGDGTFDRTWASTDYQVEPLNAVSNGQAWAYTGLRAVGPSYLFPTTAEAGVQITADWGWPTVPKPVENACLIQAIALFKAKDAPLGLLGGLDGPAVRVSSFLHPQARMLLAPFRARTPEAA